MVQILEVIPHPTGPWLVKAGKTAYAVPPFLGRALRPLSGGSPGCGELRASLAGVRADSGQEFSAPAMEIWLSELSQALAGESVLREDRNPHETAGRAIRLRIPLIPAKMVGRCAEGLRSLTGTGGLVTLALLGAGGYLAAGYLSRQAWSGSVGFSWDPGTVAAGLGLFLLSTLWHELGHAAALMRAGYPPGGIGAGVLFVIPVLFADVTAVRALPRSGRIRVDVSGVIFQLAAGGAFMILGAWRDFSLSLAPALALAGSSALLAITWSLFPFIRSDGYWFLCDLLSLDDLDRRPPGPVGRGLRVFLVGFQLTNALFLLVIGIYIPWRMIGLLIVLAEKMGLSPDPFPAIVLASLAGAVFLGLMGIGLTRKIVVLVRSAATVAKGH